MQLPGITGVAFCQATVARQPQSEASMDRPLARLARIGILLGLLTSLALATAVPAAAATEYSADLTADAVVPGPGDPSAQGSATFLFLADQGRSCAFIEFDKAIAPTSVVIGEAEAGESGPAVITFPASGDADEFYSQCVDVDPAVVDAIVANPSGYFLQVATESAPDGASRGQIEAFEPGINVSFAKYACPGKVRSIDDIDPITFAPCVNAARTGDIDPAPPGFQYDPKPILFDLEATITDSTQTQTLDQAELDGGGSCNPDTMTSFIARGYLWFGVTEGPVSVQQLTAPTGYRFGTALVSVEGSPLEAEIDKSTGTVSFDTAGVSGTVSVAVFDFRGPIR
jgi:hypothetical protein